MEYIILFLEKGKSALLGKVLQDDMVSRQSIKVQEPSSLGLKGEGTYIMIDGAHEALTKAKEIGGPECRSIEGAEKEDIRKRILEAEESVAEGLGLMFG
ncbi:MAG: hypothetical protein MUC62_03920 [Candidatus Thermoplasmatota archaeon]|jgi:hypothetical protein|nr:hypothetical protein [Candidatus Thermoplasmatota archaeon]